MEYSENVKFIPWEGSEYQYGIRGFDENGHIIYGTKENPGCKLLVVGDSFYCANPEKEAVRSIVKSTIADLLDPNSEFEPYKNTYKKFIKSLTGYYDEMTFEQNTEAWQHIMFYNYVQTPMTMARVSPSQEDYKNAEPAFWEILEKSGADLVVVWGKRLYNNLPQVGKQAEDLEIKEGEFMGDAIEIWSYNVNGKDIQLMYVNHPSAAYALEYWGTFIHQFIQERGNYVQ